MLNCMQGKIAISSYFSLKADKLSLRSLEIPKKERECISQINPCFDMTLQTRSLTKLNGALWCSLSDFHLEKMIFMQQK